MSTHFWTTDSVSVTALILVKVHLCERTHHSTGFGYFRLPVSGEPFINGEAVPYDPKYHEEYLRLTHSLIARPDHGGGNPGYPGGDQGCPGQGGDSTKSITV